MHINGLAFHSILHYSGGARELTAPLKYQKMLCPLTPLNYLFTYRV